MNELLQGLIAYVGEDYEPSMDTFLEQLLDDATEDVCTYLYPRGFGSDAEEQRVKALALRRYPGKIRRIAEYHYDKVGKEGVLSYEENGTSAAYESTDTPKSLLRGIIPVASVI